MITLIVILTAILALAMLLLTGWLLLHKARALLHSRELAIHRRRFLGIFPPLLFVEIPEESSDVAKRAWRNAVVPHLQKLKSELSSGRAARARTRREAARMVLEELSETVAGETLHRIVHFFEELGFVKEEIVRLEDRRWWIRGESAHRLGIMRSPQAVIPLLRHLQDCERDVRLAAAHSLLDIAGVRGALFPIFKHLTSITPWMEVLLARRIIAAGTASVGPLLSGLESPSPTVQRFAISILGVLRAPEVIGPIYARFSGMDRESRKLALITLGRCGDPRAAELLLLSTMVENEEIRIAAITGLGYLAAPDVVPRLTELLSDPRLAVGRAAGEALIRILPEGKDALVEIAEHSAGTPRILAMHFLDVLATEEAA